MIFTERLAKLGKADIINCTLVSGSPLTFNVYVSIGGVKQKTLIVTDNQYSLSKPVNEYIYNEILQIDDNFLLARIGDSFSILKQEDRDGA